MKNRTRMDQGCQKKTLCTPAAVFVAPSPSVAGVVSRRGDIPKAIVKHEGR